ncbi:unnamed protein product, partial [Peniophora sp. CBMAI 1063]
MLLAHPFPHATPNPDTELDADAAASALLSPLPPTTPPQASFNGFPFSSPGPSAIPSADVTQSPAALFMSSFFSPPPVAATPPPIDAEGLEISGYTLGRVIARGGGGVVRAAMPSSTLHSDGQGEVAVKIVARSALTPLERTRADAEVTLWEGLLHEHILPLFNTYHTPLATYLFMPLCPSGTLLDILRRDGTPGLPTPFASHLWRQVVSGVRYLHEEAKVVHGDLKLENVLLDAQGSARIADFGLASQIKEGEQAPRRQRSVLVARKDGAGGMSRQRSSTNQGMGSGFTGGHWGGARERSSAPVVDSMGVETVYELPAGSLPYAAPELLHPPAPGAPYVPATPQDIWALGVMLYALLAGRLPFSDSFEPRLTVKILRGVYDPPPAAGPLIARCLALNSSARWTAAQLDAVAWTADAEGSVAESEMARLDAEAQAVSGADSAALEADLQSVASPASSSAVALDRSRSRARVPVQDVIYEDADEEPAPSPSRGLLSSAALSFSPVRSTSSPRTGAFASPARIASSLSGSSFSSARDQSVSMSRERGRLPHLTHMMHREVSRSPSPSRPPATPTDTLPPSLAAALTARDVSRGRKARAPELSAGDMMRHGPSLERHAAHADELERHGAHAPYPRQDSVEGRRPSLFHERELSHDGGRYQSRSPERRRPRSYQASPHSASHSYSHLHALPMPMPSPASEKFSRRAGSQPPAPWPASAAGSRHGGVTPARRTPGGGFGV